MGQSIKTGKDGWLCVGPCLHPDNWPAALANGFEGLVPYAGWTDADHTTFVPTAEEVYNRDQAICGIDQWSRHCKTTVSITQGAETVDVSDDCNDDATIVSKLTRELTFESFNRKGVLQPDGTTLPIPPETARCLDNAYKSEGCLLVPLLWTDCPKADDGAKGIFMLATITQLDITGALNDPIGFSFTAVPGATPVRLRDELPMYNVMCVTCFSDTSFADLDAAAPDYYYGELAENDPDLVATPVITIAGSNVVLPSIADPAVLPMQAKAPKSTAAPKKEAA